MVCVRESSVLKKSFLPSATRSSSIVIGAGSEGVVHEAANHTGMVLQTSAMSKRLTSTANNDTLTHHLSR